MNDLHQNINFMQRCIGLAQNGIRDTLSNPMVGCVIVYAGKIIGEGHHQSYGGPHAEINALNSIKPEFKKFIPRATLYVSLEPCSHSGKTPPCAHRIISEGIKNVVIGCMDPNPVVAGSGIQLLEKHGVNVVCGVLENQATELITKFKSNLAGMPYIILKWAQSKDLFISKLDTQTWLSNEFSRTMAHKWRSEVDGILIGKNTALIDDPSLNVREYIGPSPTRILLDSTLKAPTHLKLLSDGHPTMIVNTIKESIENNLTYLLVNQTTDLGTVLRKIYQAGTTSIMVEGGASILKSFIKSGYWHEARVIQTQVALEVGLPAPSVEGKLIKKLKLGGDEICFIKNNNPALS